MPDVNFTLLIRPQDREPYVRIYEPFGPIKYDYMADKPPIPTYGMYVSEDLLPEELVGLMRIDSRGNFKIGDRHKPEVSPGGRTMNWLISKMHEADATNVPRDSIFLGKNLQADFTCYEIDLPMFDHPITKLRLNKVTIL